MKKINHEELLKKKNLSMEDLENVVGGAGGPDAVEQLYTVVGNRLGIERRNINPKSTIEELGADSLDVVDVLKSIMKSFDDHTQG